MRSTTRKVAIILVVHHDKDKIKRLYDSLVKQTYQDFSVYLVDSDSTDGSPEYVKEINNESQLDIQYISLSENVGFAKGNNIGAARAAQEGCEYFFVLNPDMELNAGCIAALLELAETADDIGVVGPLVLFGNEEDREDRIQVFGSTADFKSQRKQSLFANEKLSDVELPDHQLVDFVNGGSTFIKREVFERIGLFEERYFMYNDEIDLGFRVKESGYRTYVSSKAKVWHHHDWSKQNRHGYYLMYYYMLRNRYLYFRKHRHYRYMLMDLFLQLVRFPVIARFAMRTAGTRMLKFYYLGILHGLISRGGKSKLPFC